MSEHTPRKTIRALIAMALSVHASEARAAPVIELVAPPRECPNESELDARVRALAPNESFSGQHARARVDSSGGEYRAELTLTLGDGTTRERTVQAETCETAMQALAVIFVASQAELSSAEPSPGEPRPSSTPPTLPFPRPLGDRTPEARVLAPSPWRFALAAKAVMDRGLLPESAFGGLLEANAAKRWARGVVGVGALAPTDARSPFGATARIHALFVDIAFCGEVEASSLRLGGCAGMSLVVLRGRGEDVQLPRDEDRFVPTVRASFDARWPARTPLGVRLSIGSRVPLARPEFSILNDGSLHRPAGVCGDVAIGPDLRF